MALCHCFKTMEQSSGKLHELLAGRSKHILRAVCFPSQVLARRPPSASWLETSPCPVAPLSLLDTTLGLTSGMWVCPIMTWPLNHTYSIISWLNLWLLSTYFQVQQRIGYCPQVGPWLACMAGRSGKCVTWNCVVIQNCFAGKLCFAQTCKWGWYSWFKYVWIYHGNSHSMFRSNCSVTVQKRQNIFHLLKGVDWDPTSILKLRVRLELRMWFVCAFKLLVSSTVPLFGSSHLIRVDYKGGWQLLATPQKPYFDPL